MAEFINTVDVIGDDALTDSIILRTIEELHDENMVKLHLDALKDCKSLVSVDLPNVVREWQRSFDGCTSLQNVNLPKLENCGYYMFRECRSLKEICLPSVKKIGPSAFHGCVALEKMDLPVATDIQLTDYCGLKTLILRNKEAVCVLGGALPTSTYIYVPRTLADGSDGVAAYKAATNWAKYGDNIVAIEDYPDITGG